jgi:hypothetical protein
MGLEEKHDALSVFDKQPVSGHPKTNWHSDARAMVVQVPRPHYCSMTRT